MPDRLSRLPERVYITKASHVNSAPLQKANRGGVGASGGAELTISTEPLSRLLALGVLAEPQYDAHCAGVRAVVLPLGRGRVAVDKDSAGTIY